MENRTREGAHFVAGLAFKLDLVVPGGVNLPAGDNETLERQNRDIA